MARRGHGRLFLIAFLMAGLPLSPRTIGAGWAATPASLTVIVSGLTPGGVVPQEDAYCVPDGRGHATSGPNVSPAISWSAGPAGTASYAIITHDTDVPSVFTNANQEGKTLPANLRRVDFYHWVLVDVPATAKGLSVGADSNGVVENGKPVGPTTYGVRGANSFTPGAHGGYDGPCPPWNDERVHHYHFTVYALDTAHLAVSGNFSGPDVLRAMQGHILASGEIVGVYSLNPTVRKSLGLQ
ncbi:MAG TPA: YbhB/YbcL family Raf kinase inhibitor-like protein [bacterium]|nr:YbhB/YbcL family Raf kinase inhibitor-like protein [bacterium]